MKRIILALLALTFFAGPVMAGIPPIPPTAMSITGTPQLPGALNKQAKPLRIGCTTTNLGPANTQATVGQDYSQTGRIPCTSVGAVSQVQALFGVRGGTGGSEGGTQPPSYIVRGSVETSLGVTLMTCRLCANGGLDLVVPAIPGLYGFDPTQVFVGPASQYYLRIFERIAAPVTSPSAAAFNGGGLATATAYYCKITNVDTTLESGPATEVTATTGATTLAIKLAWTNATYTSGAKIYCGTATNTEGFVAQVAAGQTGYVYDGSISPNLSVTPPAQVAYPVRRGLLTGETTNNQHAGGAGTDQTGATGAITGTTGPGTTLIATPELILTDDNTRAAIYGDGDSIEFGTGILNSLAGSISQPVANWFVTAMQTTGGYSFSNFSIPGSTILGLVSGNTSISTGRLAQSQYCDYFITNLGINDLAAGQTWQQVATNHLALAKQFYGRGCRYVPTTILPSTTTTGAWLAGTQTVKSYESARVAYNDWLRAGSPVLAGAPVAPGTSGAVVSPYIYSYIDNANAVEVNSSNVLTQDGGFWLAPSSALYTGQVLTGSPSTTSLPVSTASYPVSTGSLTQGLLTYWACMTSGAASGQCGMVSANTATGLTLYPNGSTTLTGNAIAGLTTNPAAGDTFSIYVTDTADGTHPTYAGHQLLAAPLETWLPLKAVNFGGLVP